MSFISKIPLNNTLKTRRIPNAFMLFVKEQKRELVQKCPEESKNVIGAFLGKKWRSLGKEEKQVYFDKYNALKELNVDNFEINAMKTEKQTENECMLQSVIGEISDINSTIVLMDQKTNKSTCKRKADEVVSTNNSSGSKVTAEQMSASTSNITCFESFSKEKSNKKIRRSPNAFMLFARDKRGSLELSNMKDKKYHASKILGNMWKELPASKKKAYFEEARSLHNSQGNSDAAASPDEDKTRKKKTKLHSQKKGAKRSVGRPKKIKDLSVVPTLNFSNTNGNDTGRKEENATDVQSSSVETSEKNTRANESFESRDLPDLPNDGYQQASSMGSHFHHSPSSFDCHHSRVCFCWHTSHHLTSNENNSNMKQFPSPDEVSGFSTMNRPCIGAGLSPPFFNPFVNSAFWMYPQMAQQMCLHPSFFHPYCCGPYSHYPNTYFSSYFSGRCNDPFSNPSHASSSSTAVNCSNRNEQVDAPKDDDNSEGELVIVDEDSTSERPQNITEQHQ